VTTDELLDLDVCEVCGADPGEECANCAPPPPDDELAAALARTPEEWSDLWRERYDPAAAFIDLCHSCVRCGRSWAGFGTDNEHHYCGPPYFRPRGRLHPSGPTAAVARAEQHAHANPTLF
jgi:hypothetical protein